MANSLRGRKKVELEYPGPPGREVFVAGTFNDWDPRAKPMKPDVDGGYYAILMLPKGKHEYKFIEDGHWRADPTNAAWTCDGLGGMNSVLEVR